jgi:phosphoadenosine phosphosulfate reductase
MPTETISRPTGEVGAADLNLAFAELTPTERIERAAELFAGQLVVASSFGPTAPVLLERVKEVAPDTPVVTIRHHHETLKTLELISWYEREFDLDLRIYDAPAIPIPLDGTPAFAEFQQRVKVEPFQEMLDELRPQAYLSGVMRWQSPSRADLPIVEGRGAVIAINPIADLSQAAVESFFAETGLPRDDTYFDPTKGRDQNQECGLNTTIYRDKEE